MTWWGEAPDLQLRFVRGVAVSGLTACKAETLPSRCSAVGFGFGRGTSGEAARRGFRTNAANRKRIIHSPWSHLGLFGSLALPFAHSLLLDSDRFDAYRRIHAMRVVARSNHLPDLSSKLF